MSQRFPADRHLAERPIPLLRKQIPPALKTFPIAPPRIRTMFRKPLPTDGLARKPSRWFCPGDPLVIEIEQGRRETPVREESEVPHA